MKLMDDLGKDHPKTPAKPLGALLNSYGTQGFTEAGACNLRVCLKTTGNQFSASSL